MAKQTETAEAVHVVHVLPCVLTRDTNAHPVGSVFVYKKHEDGRERLALYVVPVDGEAGADTFARALGMARVLGSPERITVDLAPPEERFALRNGAP